MTTKPDISVVQVPVSSRPIYDKLARRIPCCIFCAAERNQLRYTHTGDNYYVVCTSCGAAGPKTTQSLNAAVELYTQPFKKMRDDLATERTNGYNAGRSESYELRCGLRQFAKMIEQPANEPEE